MALIPGISTGGIWRNRKSGAFGATAAVGREDKHTNASPHQLHLPVGPAADQLHSVKVGELHLQLLQLTGRLLICRVDTWDIPVRKGQESYNV